MSGTVPATNRHGETTVQPTDNSQFAEEQRTEAYRHAHMAHVERQTKALESIRTIMVLFVVLAALGAIFWVAAVLGGM